MILLWTYYVLSFLLGLLPLSDAKELRLSDQYQQPSETFIPPKVFRQSNLIRNIQLEKVYARETISIVVENIDKLEQYDYFLPFDSEVASRIGGFEAGDKDQLQKGLFSYEVVGNDTFRSLISMILVEGMLKNKTVLSSISGSSFLSRSSRRSS